jgi:aminopeptidase N
VTYKGIPADGLIISKNKFGKRTFFGDNWPDRARHWLPCVDDPGDKASVEFLVEAPASYQVVANGELKEEKLLDEGRKRTWWSESVALPTKVMVIGVAEFAVQTTGEKRRVPVSSWVFPENRDQGFRDYAIAGEILNWLEDYIGPYPYRKLANVQSKTRFGGMENASAIFYAENSVSGDREVESLICHEIAHQWFGNMATEESYAHLWLSEGFATYLTHLYTGARYGADSLKQRMAADRESVLDFVRADPRPVVDSSKDLLSLLNANSYQKGSWVLHMLRMQLGDSLFHASIREYYATFSGRNASTDDLRRIFEKNSGQELEVFFRQWLHTSANPEIQIRMEQEPGTGRTTITVEQIQRTEPFIFPLTLLATEASGRNIRLTIPVTKRMESIAFSTVEPLISISPDPDCALLAHFRIMEQ